MAAKYSHNDDNYVNLPYTSPEHFPPTIPPQRQDTSPFLVEPQPDSDEGIDPSDEELVVQFLYVSLGDIQGGWDTDIFMESTETKDEYLCTICTGLLREPVITRCGHLFCATCFDKHRSRRGLTTCPLDRKVIKSSDFFPDRFVKKQVEKLRVHCPFDRENCLWSGPLVVVREHMKNCGYGMCLCRDCNIRIKRKDKLKHENTHLKDKCAQLAQQVTTLKLNSKSKLNQTLNTSIGAWDLVNKSLVQGGNFISPYYWIIKDVIGQIEASNEIFSPPFLSMWNGYQFCARLNMSGHGTGTGTHLSLYLYIMQGPYDDQLEWPTKHGFFRASLMNQKSGKEITPHYTKTVSIGAHPLFRKKPDVERRNTSAGWQKYIDFFDLMNERYYVDDTVVIMLGIIIPDVLNNFTSTVL